MIQDGYGEHETDSTIRSYEGWLAYTALGLTLDANVHRDDLVQEGRIAMWRAMGTFDASRGPLGPWLMLHARKRMLGMVSRNDPTTGHTREVGRPEVKPSTSIDREIDRRAANHNAPDVVSMLFGLVDSMDEIEVAYHHGEIMAAIQSLNPKQRAYVYARFWCGMEGTSDAAVMLRQANPHLADRNGSVWNGRNQRGGGRTPGARERLAESLAHLRVLVTS